MKALIIQGQGKKCEADKVLIRATINVWLIVINCHALYYWYYKAANIFVPSSALCHVKYQYLKY